MDDSVKQLWTFCMWYAGISATVTLSFFLWLASLSNRIGSKERVHDDLVILKEDLREIKTALIGDYNKKGLLTKYHELEDRIAHLEKS